MNIETETHSSTLTSLFLALSITADPRKGGWRGEMGGVGGGGSSLTVAVGRRGEAG